MNIGGGGGATMAADGGEKGSNFYAVLGLEKECTTTELRNAYKKLALRWHPDRCCASGNLKFVEDAKKKFQNIQEAYSVLSDDNKRFLYDVGVYDNDDDEIGMGGFLNEMVAMMGQTKPSEKEEGSFEELQQLFEDMFQGESNNYGFGCPSSKKANTTACSTSSSYTSSTPDSSNKRNLTEMNYGKTKVEDAAGFGAHFQSFCVGVEQHQDPRKGGRVRGGIRGRATGRRRNSRKQKVSSGHEVLAGDYSGISA